MKTFLTVFALAAGCAGLAVADTWSGRLMDASCYQKEKKAQPCGVTGSTTAFAVDINGKVFLLDQAGNSKVAAAMKDRPADPSKPQLIAAKITGTASGETIQVENVDLP